jgi:hypothetical protein
MLNMIIKITMMIFFIVESDKILLILLSCLLSYNGFISNSLYFPASSSF